MKLIITLFTITSIFCYCKSFAINSKTENNQTVPIALFHGYGDVCDTKLQSYLTEKHGIFTLCIEPSPDPENGASYSTSTPIKVQGDSACNMLNKNPLFSGEFDLMGFSQGTIISRYIIQHCNLKGKVRNFISFGGPLNGQSYTPCAFYNIPCLLINLYCSYFIFTDHLQNTWAPTNYFKDPNNYAEYLNKSTFLAEANNERYFSEEIRQKFLNLNRCMFIKWDSDGVLQPEESAWWGEFDINFKPIHRNNTVLYQKDLIGIKTLEMEGRAKFVSIPGKHMNYTLEQIDNIIVPFLHGR